MKWALYERLFLGIDHEQRSRILISLVVERVVHRADFRRLCRLRTQSGMLRRAPMMRASYPRRR